MGPNCFPSSCWTVWPCRLGRVSPFIRSPRWQGLCSSRAVSGCWPAALASGGFKEPLTALSLPLVASEAFEDDNCSNFVSEDDSETQSVSSFSSGPTSPSEMPDQFPAVVRPGSLDLPSPVSLSEFGIMFPVLGPRSECSGASSPECEVERGESQPSPQ